MLEYLEIGEDQLPEIVQSGTTVDEIVRGGSRQLGFFSQRVLVWGLPLKFMMTWKRPFDP
ncbi:MAG: hypothetical protein QXP96_04005 [Thermoproteota archaeon]